MTAKAELIKQASKTVGRGSKGYKLTYRVQDDTDNTKDISVEEADLVTPMGGTYQGVDWKSKNITPQEDSDKSTYIVEVTYDSSGGEKEDDTPPEQRRADISWNWSGEEKEFYIDVDGKHLVNSAGQVFDPLPRRMFPKNTITWSKTFLSHTDISKINLHCNAGPVTIDGVVFAAKKLLCVSGSENKSWEIDPVTGILKPYYKVSVTLAEHAVESWSQDWTDIQYEDRGTTELVNGKPQPIFDAAGEPIEKPHPLDGAGRKASSADSDPGLIAFAWYPTANFPNFTM